MKKSLQHPAAKPSKPSIKFNVLVIPTIQNIVIGMENTPKSSNLLVLVKGLVIASIFTSPYY